MKRAQGNTLWIVIFAILALVALVVLIVIFTNTTTDAQQGLLSCESKGGKCFAEEPDCPDSHPAESGVFTCQEGKKCCLSA
ncbi:MAG: hypothetical protein CMH61_01735 [Nanoarchaeota archaeon]|nr:hypothetical protein [Nanoarchaeota archaeon]|tara:strand:+ start:2486 stop:2728 length:243 start_codon:yes stop_codon:yes gene_type:complete